MLWSLLKIVLFLAVVAALTWGAGRLADAEGAIRISAANTEVTLGPLQAAIALLLLILAVWIVVKLAGLLIAVVRFLNGDDTALTRLRSRRARRRGLDALADAMLALASGDGKEAQSKAERAERYLERPDLTRLLIAQSAEMTGDHDRAASVYKELVRDDRTRFVGVRGLLKQKLESGDTDTALALAERAFALKPRHGETQDTLLRLQAARHDWSGARETLGAKLKYGQMPRDVHRRRDAVLALGQARDILDAEQSVEAREAAIEANRLSPDLVPAAALAARQYIDSNQSRAATRILKKAWQAQPHPDLAQSFAGIAPEETPQERVRRFSTLTRIHPDHPETRMLLAELQIAAENFPEARRALGDLATAHPTTRSVSIMAAIERGEGAKDAVVRGWLTRALSAPRGPVWLCDNCRTIHGEWGPVCGNCGAFDTMSWREPQGGIVAMPVQSEMLPLLVGSEDDTGVSVAQTRDGERGDVLPTTQGSERPSEDPGTPADRPGDDDGHPATSVPEAEIVTGPETTDDQTARAAPER